jgi:hypothetical protein
MRKNYPSTSIFSQQGLIQATLVLTATTLVLSSLPVILPGAQAAPKAKPNAAKEGEQAGEKGEKSEKQNVSTTPEPPIENVVGVTTTELADKPRDYLNKNVKFIAKFFAFNNLALDYKPALRPSKTHLSFIVLRPEAHIPFSEIKLAMAIPKEKDPASQVLTSLKEGDQVEVIGKVFATPLDEPWIDVLRLKRLSSAEDKKEKDDKKVSSADNDSKGDKKTPAETAKDTKPSEKQKDAGH